MDSYIIDLEVDGFSQEEFSNIKVCLETLLSVRAGSQPLDREFGINFGSVVGYPLNVARNMLSLEIMEKVHRSEPRVEIESVKFDENTNGQLIPRIHFKKAEG